MSFPALVFGKSSNVPFHPFDEFNVNVSPLTATLFAYNCTVIDNGLNPSWLLVSDHIFVTGISIVSGVPVNSTVTVSVVSVISTIGCSDWLDPSSLIWFELSVPLSHNVFFLTLFVISIFIFIVFAKFLGTLR